MKQCTKSLLLNFCVIMLLISCNNTNKQKDEDKQDNEPTKVSENVVDVDCRTIANFFIPESEARDLMGHFDSVYAKKGQPGEIKEIVDSFWIDACTIKGFKKFLNDSTRYDGIRIYSTFETPILRKNKSNIVIVPTILYDSIHVAQWGNKIPDLTSCNHLFDKYNFTMSDAQKIRRKFENQFRRETTVGNPNTAIVDSLSRGIWFSKCVIDSLSKYLENSNWDLDGVNLHCAAYRVKERNTKQRYPNQSTFLFVLTQSDGHKGHKERWDIISQLSWVIEKWKSDAFGGGYNHGELCPDDCPPGEN